MQGGGHDNQTPVPFFNFRTMIRLNDIQEHLLPLVGWQQNYNPQHEIDKVLCQSESGLTFQGAHPLCTLENVRAIMPDDYLFTYPNWNQLLEYKVGTKVLHGGNIWICNQDNVNVEPELSDFNDDYNNDFGSESAGYWVLYKPMSDFVRNLMLQGINQMVMHFLTEKQLNHETRSLMERRTFFDGAARLQSIITPRGRLVGIEIVPVRSMGVTAKIERIGLQMTGATGTIKMYLFHSSQTDPIQVEEFAYTNTNGCFQWFTPEKPMYMPYIADGNDSGGAWYLCYAQDELPDGMRALNVTKDWSAEPCATCLGGSLESWRQLTKYLQASPFCTDMPEGFSENPIMFDNGRLAYTNTMNWGINAEITVGCDLTDFIISQRMVFANVLQLQVAANVLRTIAMNPDVRVNRNQVNVTRNELLYEIDGATQGRPSGIGYELTQAYKALRFDTQGLDRICLKCNNMGVKYRTV